MRIPGRSWAAVALVAAAVPAAGCGSDSSSDEPKTIDPTRIEKAIEVSIAQQRHRLSIVVCPIGIERAAKSTFTCIATLAHGEQTPFKVTQKDDKGNVHFEAVGSTTPNGDASTTSTTTTSG